MFVSRSFGLVLSLVLVAAMLAPVSARSAVSAPSGEASRVIVIGVDGGDGHTVKTMMDAGDLPNMKRLRDMGAFAPLGTALPADSPTAWASLNSGRNPAETNVPGFVRRVFSGKTPTGTFGHIKLAQTAKLNELANQPLTSKWSVKTWWGIGFGVAFLGFLILFKGLLRMKFALALLFSTLLGGVGAWAAGNMRAGYADEYPYIGNVLEAENFWDIAGRSNVKSVILDAAASFGGESPEGVDVLHGLGVPDLRGGLGNWYIYTDDLTSLNRPPQSTSFSTAGYEYRVDVKGGAVNSLFYGPLNFVKKEQYKKELAELEARMTDTTLGYQEANRLREELTPRAEALKTLLGSKPGKKDCDEEVVYGISKPLSVVSVGDGKYDITLGESTQTLAVGEWSDYYELTFEMSPMIKAKGTTRLKLESFEPGFRLFVNTLDIAAEAQPFWQPITSPMSFGADLAKTGAFETYGWACMTMPFKDGQISPETLLEDIEFTFKWRERLFFDQIKRKDWRLFMGVFSATDRVQHMFYQFYDDQHPLYDAAAANRKTTFFGEEVALKDAIPAIFKQVDRVVGRVLDEELQKDDVLLMCADHGFQTFRNQVHTNNILIQAGLMKLKDGLTDPAAGSNIGDYVDWNQTKAYSMGLGGVYVNLRGREPYGIVAPEDKSAVIGEIQTALLGFLDPATGQPVMSQAYVTSEVHSGPYLEDEPDVMTGFAPTYRNSWATAGGKASLVKEGDGVALGPIVVDNLSPWSGGHPSVAAEHVQGLFFSSRPVNLPPGGPNLLHIAPTVLSLLGVPIPEEMDLAPLTFK